MKATPELVTNHLVYFREPEFRNLAMMEWDFLVWLDDVRHRANVPFVLTSDGRTFIPEGGSPTSLHPQGLAVDFRWTIHDGYARARIARAVIETPLPVGFTGFHLGLEPGAPGGPHWHLGLSRDNPDYLFVK